MAKPRESQQREGNEIEFSRIVAFSDGVFAIAITLLVLSLHVPEHLKHGESLTEALWEQRHNLLAYGISFAVIGRFWVVHHRFFSEVTGFDGRLLGLNIFYLAWIVLIPFTSQLLGEQGDETAAVVAYALNLALVALVGQWMASDARAAGLAESDPTTARESRIHSLFIAAVFIGSMPVAFLSPEWTPLIWLILVVDPVERLDAMRSRGLP